MKLQFIPIDWGNLPEGDVAAVDINNPDIIRCGALTIKEASEYSPERRYLYEPEEGYDIENPTHYAPFPLKFID